MSVVVGEAVEALNEFPAVNSSIDGSDVIYHGYYDIGIAVSSERSLVAPILRDADQRSLADIEKAIVDFGTRAKANKLTMDDLTGGRSEEHTSELQSLMRISYAVFCLKKKNNINNITAN